MPIYEFECPTDGRWEDIFSIKDEDQSKPCPKCKTPSPKVPSLGSFELHGPDWYKSQRMEKLSKDYDRKGV